MKSLIEISKDILTGCMDLKKEETLLVITDTLKFEIGKALYQAGLELGANLFSCPWKLALFPERNLLRL